MKRARRLKRRYERKTEGLRVVPSSEDRLLFVVVMVAVDRDDGRGDARIDFGRIAMSVWAF
jgi:hypothetical protein